jgi:alpha-glucosidase (family GH31 glycosyl hydrolase)
MGSGKYVQHWTGDNDATWPMLQVSLAEIFNFQLFGIPMVGVDICGFANNATAEMCARWMQVGVWYPFSRNHNINTSIPQEPYAFPNSPYVLSSCQKSLRWKYNLLKWYYSLFVRNNGTGTIFRPLFFEYPNDT